jgi:hypothetical protein
LFQSLVTLGIEDQEFIHISDLLTNNPLVKDGDSYDAQRLSADALRHLYLKLLRDELRAEEQDGAEEASQTTPKKRKAPSPPLPSIKDSYEYRDKLPLLVDRLYARYKACAIQAIEEDESVYAAIQREIREIERGEWDERLLKEAEARSKNGTITTPQPNSNGLPVELLSKDVKAIEISKQPYTEPLLSPQSEYRPEGLALSDVLNNPNAVSAASPKISELHPGQNPPQANHQRTGSNGPNGPSPFQPPPGSYHPNGALRWEPPYGPGHQPPPYQPGPYAQYPSPQYAASPGYLPPRPGSFSGPQPHPHVPSSPINTQHPMILPPPHPNRSPSTPVAPLSALADMAGQQYRPLPGSPVTQQGPISYQQPYVPQRPLSGNGQPQWNQNQQFAPYSPLQHPHPHAQYPPNQRAPFAPHLLQQPATQGYTSPYNANQGPRPPQVGSSRARPSLSSLPSTPTNRGPFIPTTGSGTRWTPQVHGTSTPTTSHSRVSKPPVEPISPILKPGELAEPEPQTEPEPKLKPDPELEQSLEETPRPVKKFTKKTTKSKPPPRSSQRTRAGSTASSVIGGSHRSQSVMSHADEMSIDDRPVKEEVATPVGVVDDAGDTTADELPRHPKPNTKRKRASSLDPEPEPGSHPIATPPTHVLWTRAFPKISASALEAITGHKNASTFAAPVKERDAPGYKTLILRPQDLKSIRSAINAGYKAASAMAPADTNPNASSVWLSIHDDIVPPKGIVNYSQLEKELMRMFANAVMFNADPDRGFGRRWRGAGRGSGGEDSLGYEIDEDGVVKDTKHMFADVEKIISSLRSAERRSEEISGLGCLSSFAGLGNIGRDSSVARASTKADDEDDDGPVDGEHHAGIGSVKRRRKA